MIAATLISLALTLTGAGSEEGFVSLFDGESLEHWRGMLVGDGGYQVEDGSLVCPKKGGGMLFSKKTFSDFVLRFEFKLEPGGNNGVGIRAPLLGNPAYAGMEIQILDDDHPKYADLRPEQYHGSIYDVVPARRGSLRPAGQWNEEEIRCEGGLVRVTVNGEVIVDADLSKITDPETLKRHPGLRRTSGHLCFMGHGARVEFRNIRIKDLSEDSGT